MNILMLGGTRFFGKQAVRELLSAGHEVTIATRGRSKDEFGDRVKRIVLDREDQHSLESTLRGKCFDVVYDNICYAPDDVSNLLGVMEGQIGKYIVTSSLGVYDQGYELNEDAFDPYTYPIKDGKRKDYSYTEGKRLVEAVMYQKHRVPSIAVRFPVVIGPNDYTRRLAFYTERIQKGGAFTAHNSHEPMCFITEEEAGRFLALLAEAEFVGPINASSEGTITVREIIEEIEEQTGMKAQLVEESEAVGPYSTFGNTTLNSECAKRLGMKFEDVKECFKKNIAYECKA